MIKNKCVICGTCECVVLCEDEKGYVHLLCEICLHNITKLRK